MTYAEAIAKAAEALGKGVAIKESVDPAVADILGVVGRLRGEGVDVRDLLNGDPIHDRAVVAGAALDGELTAATNWADVAGEAFRIAFSVFKAAAGIAAVLA